MSTKIKTYSKFVPIIIFATIILSVALYGFFFLGREDNIIQGEADVTEIRISGKVPGRIEKLLVEESDFVKKGDTLAILYIPDIEAKARQAEAAEAAALAQNRKALSGTRNEQIEGAYEQWQQAKAGLEIAEKTYNRASRLYEKGVATEQKYDEAEANYKVSLAREKAAKSQYDMAINGAQSEDREAALAQVKRAEGAFAEVMSYIDERYLISPIDGRVSDIYPNIGELVGSGSPVMTIADLSNKWGVFNVREDKLANYKIGANINVYVPALDRNVEMQIYKMKDMGTYAVWKSTKTLGSYDRKTFQVKAKFINERDVEDILPGMSLIINE